MPEQQEAQSAGADEALVQIGVLLVGKAAEADAEDGSMEPRSPDGQPIRLERVADLAEARAALLREGYRFRLAVIGDPMDPSEETLEDLIDIASNRPWIGFWLPLDKPPPKAGEALHSLNNILLRSSRETSSSLNRIIESIHEELAKLPPAPYPPNGLRLLREAGPLLFSLCHVERPWELECDAAVVPVTPSGDLGSFGSAWDEAAAPSPPLEERASLVASESLLAASEPRFDPEPFKISVDGRSGALRLLFATSEELLPSVAQAVTACLAALRQAAGEPGVETLLLPLIGTGDGNQDVEKVLRGLVDGFDPHWELGDLKHVIVPTQDAELFADQDLGEPPTPVKSQQFENDEPRGEDRLGVETEVKALADAIALRDMTPPLVVGILGGWGVGKSFVLHLLRERLREIRCWDVSDPQGLAAFPFVGHPYLVYFDAWTYAKKNLWASLMHAILEQMNQQLQLEQQIERQAPGMLRRGVDIWTAIRLLKSSELDALGQELGLGQEVLSSLKGWQIDEHLVEELWRGLRREHKRQRRLLGNARAQRSQARKRYRQRLEQIEKDLQVERRTLDDKLAQSERKAVADLEGHLQQARDDLEKQEGEIRDRFKPSDVREAAWQATELRLKQEFGERVVQRMEKQASPDVLDLWTELRKWHNLWQNWRRSLSPAHAVYLVVTVGAIPLAWQLADQVFDAASEWWPMVASLLTGLAGTAGSIGTALRSARERLEQEQSRFQQQLALQRALAEADLERELREQLTEQRQRVRLLERQRARAAEEARAEARFAAAQRQAELEVRQRLTERERDETLSALDQRIAHHKALVDQDPRGPTVHELIQERLRSGYYAEHLGLVHRVQEDLLQLSQALLPRDEDLAESFPRGKPRIVLVIDDLDRCPPPDVVQVLEAAQLLVKTELFVVVLAMDVRYVTRALEKEYQDILVSDGVPSGLDYIEKIVQIPYRVPDIEPRAVRPFLSSQMEVVIQEGQTSAGDEAQGEATQQQGEKIVFQSSKTAADIEQPALPESAQKFSSEELDLLDVCCRAVEISPRSVKRLVNVFKLMKIIWHHRGAHREPSLEVKQAMVLLLVLAARQPVVMRDVLRDLDGFLRRGEALERGLAEVLKERICKAKTEDNWRAVEHLVAVVDREDLLAEELKLGSIEAGNLRLVRSFSFVGETVEDVDITASAESQGEGDVPDGSDANPQSAGGLFPSW